MSNTDAVQLTEEDRLDDLADEDLYLTDNEPTSIIPWCGTCQHEFRCVCPSSTAAARRH